MHNKFPILEERIMEKVYFCGDDHLGLGAYGQSIRYIIEKSDGIVRSNDNESFVMGIDAPWGTGKTDGGSLVLPAGKGKGSGAPGSGSR